MALELPLEFRRNEDGPVTAVFTGEVFRYEHPYYPGKWIAITSLIRNRLLVRMDVRSKKTPSGILWLPDKKIQSSQVGTILMKTNTYWDYFSEEWRDTDEFEMGSRVIFRPTSGIPLYYNQKFAIWFFRPGSIMAMLEKDEHLAPHEMPITPFATEEEEYPEIDGEDDDQHAYSDEEMGITRTE